MHEIGSMDRNEHLAAWKVVLPLGRQKRALVLGGRAWLPRSLARSGLLVDWVRSGRQEEQTDIGLNGSLVPSGKVQPVTTRGLEPPYDFLILADKAWAKSGFPASKCGLLLASGGVLIIAGLDFRPDPGPLSRFVEFRDYLFFGALPPTVPRLFIPLDPLYFCRLAISFHLPGRWQARFGLGLIKRAMQLGGATFLKRRGVVFCCRKDLNLTEDTLAAWLARKLCLQKVNLAVYCGAESARRKVTLLVGANGSGGAVLFVAKVADTSAGADALNQESAALRYLAARQVPFSYPRLILEDWWQGHAVQVQQAFDPQADWAGSDLGRKHLVALAALAQLARRTVCLAETWQWRRIQDALDTATGDFPAVVRALWRTCQRTADGGRARVPVSMVHGDFTSWNMRSQKGRLAIFDWEESRLDGLPFADLFRFIYRQALMVGPWPGGSRLLSGLSRSMKRLGKMAGYDEGIGRRVLPLLLLCEYLERPHPCLLEIAELL